MDQSKPLAISSTPDFSAGAATVKQVDTPARKKKEIRRPLKPRDIKFIEAKVKNPDLPDYKAAMAATGTDDINVASTQANRMLKNVTLRETLDEAMAELGYSINGILDPVKQALDYQDPNGDERAELEIRLKGHDRAMKLLTIIAGEDGKPPAGNTFNFIGNNLFVKKDAA